MLLIKNGFIRPIDGEDIPGGQVLIDNGKILAVGKTVEAPAGAEILDASGCLVAPGFVEGHCHIGLDEEAIGFEGADYNESTDPVTPHMRGIDGLNPMDEALFDAYSHGVTTAVTGPGSANVVGGTFLAVKLCGRRVDDMVVKNPVAMKIAFGENPKRCYGGNNKKAPITRMGTAALLRETLQKAQNYKEALDAWEKDPKENKKPDFDMKLHAMLPVMRGEIPLKSHAHRADDIFTSLRIAKEFGVDITLDHCTEGHLIAEELAAEQRPCLVGPTFGSKSKFELKNKCWDTPRALVEKGLKVAIITDAPVIPLKYLPLCAGLAMEAGLEEKEAWKAVTLNPAEIAGIAHRVGSLTPGKDADVVIYKGDPLKDMQCKTLVTIIDGKIVYKA
ncbi:MAG: amidohydrolase [Acutalibacter sp.]|jgi:imidazolonepropionase-like amidohydrolase|nr:amidohydrolase [Acutalibacter sp.]